MVKNMILIFAVDNNWNIGYDGDLLYKISEDLKRFRKLTEGNIVIMGRRTFEALPNRKSLSNRINIVLTRDKDYEADESIVINSLDSLSTLLEKLQSSSNKKMEVFVIGGGNIARQLIEYCNRAYITKVFKTFPADTLIPNLDLDLNWKVVNESEVFSQGDLLYKYVDYVKLS
ncbi:dihydrofolate reductase [Proteiniborus ethanoligenes]|uniref:dihydrofolate reductase n=1 Tax=Proteiniborus ethanoligenes TaxID=415015 RepID=A0A1H3SPB2_9FIRM|nr:dihydrofolate reductase [Proteiniborus ethanoligenes]SDZ39836.1 dihydrofolate reductase [Proteiniborus ethanoligenes]